MEDAQHFKPVGLGIDSIGDDVRRTGNHQFPIPFNASRAANGWVRLQTADSLVDTLYQSLSNQGIVLRDVFSLIIEILYRLHKPFNLHSHPTLPKIRFERKCADATKSGNCDIKRDLSHLFDRET